MTKPKVIERSSDEILDAFRQLIGDNISSLKGRKDLSDEEVIRMGRLHVMLVANRKEEREANREQLLDDMKKEDLDHLIPQAVEFLRKKSGT